ncbi:MAG: PVC-type heme-binding CxxCH protein, partial [Pirellulales bacterium]
AAEPMVRNPTSVVVDSRGRVWITEGRNYRLWITEKKGQIERQPEGDQVKILEDTNGDGKADRVTIFADGIFPAPMGLAVEEIWHDGRYAGARVYVGNSPQLLLLEDTDGDDRSDRRGSLLTGFRGVDSDHGLHGMMFGLDGRLYFTVGDTRYGRDNVQAETPTFDVIDRSGRHLQSARYGTVCRVRPDGTRMEVLAYRLRNDYETCIDSFGHVFVSDNDDDGQFGCRINWIMNGGNYGYRMPGTRLHSAEDLPGVIPKIAGTGNGSPAGLLVYEGEMLPPRFRGAVLETDAGTRQINAFPLVRSGAALRTRYEILLEGTDDWFRPIDLDTAPDGSLFIADWYDAGVGGNRVTDQTTGRIYRVATRGSRFEIPPWDRTSVDATARALNSPNRTTQLLARNLLLRFDRTAAREKLAGILQAGSPVERARALAVLASMPEGVQLVLNALRDPSAAVRETALRLLAEDATRESLLVPPGASPPAPPAEQHWQAVSQAVCDPDPGVRREVILALRYVPTTKSGNLLEQLALAWDGQDRFYLEALRLALRSRESDFLASLFEQFSRRVRSSEPTKEPAIAIPPFFPTYDNTAYVKPDDRSPPATRLGQLAGIAWGLGRAEALPVLDGWYRQSIHPDEREAIERALQQMETPRAAALLIERFHAAKDDPAEQRRLLARFENAAQGRWSFLRTDEAFHALLGTALENSRLQPDVLSAIARLRLKSFQDRLLPWVTDANKPIPLRGKTLETLASLGSKAATQQARSWLGKDSLATLDPILAESAVRSLAFDTQSSRVLIAIVGDAAFPLELRRLAVQQIMLRPQSTHGLLSLVQSNGLDEPLAKDITRQLANHFIQEVKQTAREMLVTRYGEQHRTIDFDQILSIEGEAGRGESVFFSRGATPCGKCHRTWGIGAAIGPDLSTIGTKYGRRELLFHIVFPNSAINFSYAVTSFMLDDGRVLSGVVVREDQDDVQLATAEGETVVIAKWEIEKRQSQPTSLMPENVGDSLSNRELADLLAFLGTQRRPVVELGETRLSGPMAVESTSHGDHRKRRVEAGQGGYFVLQPTNKPDQQWRLNWRIATKHAQQVDVVVESPGNVMAWIGAVRTELTPVKLGTRIAWRTSVLLEGGSQQLVIGVVPPIGRGCSVRVTLIPSRTIELGNRS